LSWACFGDSHAHDKRGHATDFPQFTQNPERYFRDTTLGNSISADRIYYNQKNGSLKVVGNASRPMPIVNSYNLDHEVLIANLRLARGRVSNTLHFNEQEVVGCLAGLGVA
jgi:hypothetical protein